MGFASDFLSGHLDCGGMGSETQLWLSTANARDRSLRVSTKTKLSESESLLQVQVQVQPCHGRLRLETETFESVSPAPRFYFLSLVVLGPESSRDLTCLASPPPIALSFPSLFPFSPNYLISPPPPSAIVSSSRHDHSRPSRIFPRATDPQALTGRP
jgi:hypothetical protein